MSTDMNNWTGIGRLVRDAELKTTQNGNTVVNFSLAVGYSYKQGEEKKEQTSFFNCIAWGKTGEAIAQYVKKGHRVGIIGRLQQRSWDDSEGKKRSTVEIIVERFFFLQPKSASTENVPQTQSEVPQTEPDATWPDDGDIPF
jgi:single-strand DNA-binding protein